MLWRATVQREDPAKPVGFSPQQQQAQAGDALFWFNEDRNVAHQPVPDSGTWNIPEIPGNNSSDQLSLANPGSLSYHCAIHPDEKGSIIVANACLIGAGANPLFGNTACVQGQSVSWGNSDQWAHQPTPVGSDKPWTAAVGSGDLSAPVAFDQPGNFNYRCAIHPDNPTETGTVAVAALVNINTGANPLFGATTIPQGAGVVWQNNDTESHQPTPDSGAAWLTSPVSAGSASNTVAFSSAGSFPYKCAVHPNAASETGTITVTST